MVLATENKLNNWEHPSVSLVCVCGMYPQFAHPKYSLLHLYLLVLVTTKEIGWSPLGVCSNFRSLFEWNVKL
jgi:hypothetical protein